MYCIACGKPLIGQEPRFCASCGAQVPPPESTAADTRGTNDPVEDSAEAATGATFADEPATAGDVGEASNETLPPRGYYDDPFNPQVSRMWTGAEWATTSQDDPIRIARLRSGTMPPPRASMPPQEAPPQAAGAGYYPDPVWPSRSMRYWSGTAWIRKEADSPGIFAVVQECPAPDPSQRRVDEQPVPQESPAPSGRSSTTGNPAVAPWATAPPVAASASTGGSSLVIAAWIPWAYTAVIGLSLAVSLLALVAGSGKGRAELNGLGNVLIIPSLIFYIVFGIWDAQRVRKAAGGGGLTAAAVLLPPLYLFLRQRRLKKSVAPAVVFLATILLNVVVVLGSGTSLTNAMTGRLTCGDLVSESIRISEENAGALQPKLVSVSNVRLVSDKQGKQTSGSHNTLLVCTGNGYYSDTQTAPTRMEYWTDSSGNAFVEYRAE